VKAFLTAAEAAKLLGVSQATLYAYVSRGFIRSEPAPGKSRARRYAREDIERLRSRNEERRDPGKAAERALHWGMPILESSITLIADGQSNADIARRLFISEATVKTHINHAFAKTGVRDRAQAVAYAYRTGLARP